MGCATVKQAEDFYKTPAGRLRSYCKDCYSKHNARMRVEHQEKRNAYDKARGTGWDRSGREKWKSTDLERWAGHLKGTYGITTQKFDEMLSAQGGVCAIFKGECNRSNSDCLCVDHDHKTGCVRGLLCFKCNVGLGRFNDDPELIRCAADYLEKSKQ